ncbi:MAG: hypothetical protein P8Y38_14020, partial [Deltaproteobacteria bacterium]
NNIPSLSYPDSLPITAKSGEIIEAIQKHAVVIISGDTGSGKTTQIPKFCLAAGRGIGGYIGCTQPRRLAATTVSHRIAEELNEPMGRSVGYKIRFRDKTHDNTRVKIMTDGILLAETQIDPFLNAYDTIIVDEAHERSLNIDFILGILKLLLNKRSDLKLIITSATIDTKKFSRAFHNAPIIEVSGRMYPVETRYYGDPAQSRENEEPSYVESAVHAVEKIQRESPFGDVLIFMPTEQDILELKAAPTRGKAAAAALRTASVFECTPKRIISAAPVTPSRKFCDPTWRKSSCACSFSSSVMWKPFPLSTDRMPKAFGMGSICSWNWVP